MQLAMLALAVSLLLVCFNYLKPGRPDRRSYEEAEGDDEEALAASSTRSRTGP